MSSSKPNTFLITFRQFFIIFSVPLQTVIIGKITNNSTGNTHSSDKQSTNAKT